MGSSCSKNLDANIDCELEEIKVCLAVLLKQLNPDELLTFATKDTEIYEICKNNSELRQACILAAVRRYHTEKFFFEAVHNRTADYVVMLDNFLQIQDEVKKQELEENVQCFSWWRTCPQDREEDTSQDGENP
ncbi:uncharacterized protein BDFB_010931 [Asbolus verrucosus]|uniref:Uncharacterized protein n=1 Tax=Asbolus verrucosus TaxID=1661398 RepID=A0A482WB31_ASBVE|nr:uncharacterized protein BDFB_010931 [Asbolus verrucosus]